MTQLFFHKQLQSLEIFQLLHLLNKVEVLIVFKIVNHLYIEEDFLLENLILIQKLNPLQEEMDYIKKMVVIKFN